ncbi:MAG TPA: hypothetical protein VH251_07565 [Verrucomicrobiae bacterium]|nr:hypothetical protein [Verrucomicrobiae bacterium]
MEKTPDYPTPAWLESMRRYVPLAVWVIVLMTLLLIPLKVLKYGYIPPDDALRSAGKAVSGKTWQQVLVLNDVYKMDHEYGWSLLLSKIHTACNADADTIVIFSVVSLFMLVGLAAVPWLRYPEVWLVSLAMAMVTVMIPFRFLLGRPYIITISALLSLLLLWRRFGPGNPKPWMMAVMTGLITASVYFHGTWYLWALPVVAFFLAGQFRWGFTVAGCSIAGVFLGCLLTGHLIEYPMQAVKVLFLATGKHLTERTLASEMQPLNGDVNALFILGGLLLLRRLAPLSAPPLLRDPVFWLVAMSWVLEFKVGRFWEDWGWPALMVLVACDLQLLLSSRLVYDSFRRLAFAGGMALVAFLSITSDVGDRWTYNLTTQFLTADNPDLAGWMPESGGILYSTDMSVFYQTFFKNPTGDWRYILGFEATLMKDEDFQVYHKVLWNFGDVKAYQPWLLKMTAADRLVIRGSRGSPPHIPQLEWNYGVSGIWIGRLPGHHQGGAPVTVPSTESVSSLIDSPDSKPDSPK